MIMRTNEKINEAVVFKVQKETQVWYIKKCK